MRPALLILIAACVPAAAHAASPVNASVDRRVVRIEEPFILTVQAEGQRMETPVIPHAEGLRFNRTPVHTGTSMSVQFKNGRVFQQAKRTWQYEVWATRKGQLEIPPVRVMVDGQNYLTEEISIHVTENASELRREQRQRARPQHSPNHADRRGPTLDDAVLLEAEVDKREVYQGEQIVLTLRYIELDVPGLQVRADRNSRLALPDTEGFYKGHLNKEQRHLRRNGWDYTAHVFEQYLYPATAGELSIGAWTWQGTAHGYTRVGSRRKTLNLRTDPITVNAKPLPEQPPGFTGAVGNFQITADAAGGPALVQGVPTRLVIHIRGEGNPDAISAPDVPDLPWAQLSDPEIQTGSRNGDGQVDKVFAYDLTPLEVGEYKIPEIAFVFFAPMLEAYRTRTTRPIRVQVQPSAESGELVVVGGTEEGGEDTVEILASDIEPIYKEAERLGPKRSRAPLNAGALVIPPLAYTGFFLYMRRRRRLQEDPEYARKVFAQSRMERRLRELDNSGTPAEDLSRALMGYLADKLNVNEAGMTSSDARDLLAGQGIDGELAEGFTKVLRRCERARYAGAALNQQEVDALRQAAESVMKRLAAALGERTAT